MAFRKISSREIPALGAVLEEYEHERLGAKHLHIRREDPERGFAAAFPTHSGKDDGVAHILEHLTLCGSERYPARDPFFAMTRRSLATFMNAMTYPDRTVYPFSAKDPEDFANLLGVYLDATLFPNLEYLDFRQEGWRLEEKEGKLSYEGVVYNEMKGALSSPGAWAWKALERELKPGTAYAGMSGGDPMSIPDLAHEDLVRFHAEHYHPSRGVFVSYGDFDPREIQSELERAFGRFPERLEPLGLSVAKEPEGPKRIREAVPSSAGADSEFSAQAGWVLGSLRDEDAALDAAILDEALLKDSAAPARKALESAGFGRLSGICGAETGEAQLSFHLGMDGLREEEVEKAFALIRETLEGVAREGIPRDRLETILRDFEMESLDIEPSGQPLGIGLMLEAIPMALAGIDPIQALDPAPALARARERWLGGDRARTMARELLESRWRVEAVFEPDPEFFEKRDEREAQRLREEESRLSPEDRESIREESDRLKRRQGGDSMAETLPKIDLAKVSPKAAPSQEFRRIEGESGPSVAFFGAKTNGIAALDLELRLDALPRRLWGWAGLWCALRGSLGVGAMGWGEAAEWRSRLGGARSATMASFAGGEESFSMLVSLRAKSFDRDAGGLAELLARSLREPRFDEEDRIAFLLDSGAKRQAQGLSSAGPRLASGRARAPFSAAGELEETLEGVGGMGFWRMANELAKTPEGMARIRERLEEVTRFLGHSEAAVIAIGSEAARKAGEELARDLSELGKAEVRQRSGQTGERPAARGEALVAPGAVGFCHAAWAAPALGDPSAGAFSALSELLTNARLHRALREEGGAYGGSASYSGKGVFAMSSYRDPRVEGTYRDFRAALEWAAGGKASESEVEEAKISALQALEKELGPRGKARASWERARLGVGQEARDAFREGILRVAREDLARAAEALASAEPSRAAVIAGRQSEEAKAAGLEVGSVEAAIEAAALAAERPGAERRARPQA